MSCEPLSLVSEGVRGLTPYQPGKSIEELEREYGITGSIKLASNENALGPSPKAVAAIAAGLTNLHRYPDGSCHYLATRLAEKLAVNPDQIVFGNGSNEIIELLINTFLNSGDEVVTSNPTFLVYQKMVQARGGVNRVVPLKKDQPSNIGGHGSGSSLGGGIVGRWDDYGINKEFTDEQIKKQTFDFYFKETLDWRDKNKVAFWVDHWSGGANYKTPEAKALTDERQRSRAKRDESSKAARRVSNKDSMPISDEQANAYFSYVSSLMRKHRIGGAGGGMKAVWDFVNKSERKGSDPYLAIVQDVVKKGWGKVYNYSLNMPPPVIDEDTRKMMDALYVSTKKKQDKKKKNE